MHRSSSFIVVDETRKIEELSKVIPQRHVNWQFISKLKQKQRNNVARTHVQ